MRVVIDLIDQSDGDVSIDGRAYNADPQPELTPALRLAFHLHHAAELWRQAEAAKKQDVKPITTTMFH